MLKIKLIVLITFLIFLPLVILTPALAGDGDNNFKIIFTDSPDDIINSNTRDITAGSDLDQDGKYEIIITDYDNGGQVHVYEVIGDNTIEWIWSSPGTPSTNWVSAREVKTGDLDNDGLGEILLSISKDNAPVDSSGIYVYEWDGINDNSYIPIAIIPVDLNLTGGFTEDFIVDDIDGDNITEAVFLNNGSDEDDNCYIISISGTFETSWSQTTEATFTRSGGSFNGNPYDVAIGDLDGDGFKEVIVSLTADGGGLFIAETTGPDNYIASTYIHIDTTGNNGYSLEGMATADFNNDGADELFIVLKVLNYSGQLVVVTGGTDVSTITFENNVRILRTEGVGALGMAIGDQDHGSGSDGPDIYVSYAGSYEAGDYVQDFEFTGTDIFDPTSYTEHVIYQESEIFTPTAQLFQLDAPQVDLDGDGNRELLLSYTGNSPNGIQMRIFEFNPMMPELTLTTPNGGEQWGANSYHDITWASENFIGSMRLEFSTDGGNAWNEIASYTANDGIYNWLIPEVSSSECLVRISDVGDGNPTDLSNGYFTIFIPADISGTVYYGGTGLPVSDAALTLTDVDGSSSDTTSSEGLYLFENITPGNVILVPLKQGDQRDAITCSDALLVLLNMAFLTDLTPEQQKAADVNEDGHVSGVDAIAILRYAAFLSSQIGHTGEWRFVPPDTSFNLSQDTHVDFKACLLGDANLNWGSASLALAKGIDNLSNADLTIGAPTIAQERELSIPILIDPGSQTMHTLLFTLAYDSTLMKLKSSIATSATQQFTVVTNDAEPGKVHLAMAGVRGINAKAELINLIFTIKDGADASSARLEFSRALINDFPAANLNAITIDFDQLQVNRPQVFGLSDNYPNPFNPETSINYQLPKDAQVTLRIYDLLGQEVKVLVNDTQKAGYYQVTWNGTDKNGTTVASGLYLYILEADQFKMVKKMTFVK